LKYKIFQWIYVIINTIRRQQYMQTENIY